MWPQWLRVRLPSVTPSASWAAGRPAVCKTVALVHAWFEPRDAHHALVAQRKRTRLRSGRPEVRILSGARTAK